MLSMSIHRATEHHLRSSTLDTDHTPRPVLPCQTHDQHGDLVTDRRTARRPRLSPLPGDQPPMPPQQRRWPDKAAGPQGFGQQPRKNREHRPIRPAEPRARVGSAQHRDLVTKQKDLRILRCRGPSKQRQPGQNLRQNLVQQSNNHDPTDHPTRQTSRPTLLAWIVDHDRGGNRVAASIPGHATPQLDD
jgi:hypothetical protein